MNIIAWIIIGVFSGFISSRFFKTLNRDTLTDLSLGVLGALVGGIILSILGQPNIANINIYSITVAILGSVILIWLGRTFKQT